MAYIAMAYMVMAYMVMAYIAMACTAMFCIAMACIAVAYIIMVIGGVSNGCKTLFFPLQLTALVVASPFDMAVAHTLPRNRPCMWMD